jgi:hypothetical protein
MFVLRCRVRVTHGNGAADSSLFARADDAAAVDVDFVGP